MAPLLIHGALAALVLVFGSARHRDQGRQDFFCGRHLRLAEPLPLPETAGQCRPALANPYKMIRIGVARDQAGRRRRSLKK